MNQQNRLVEVPLSELIDKTILGVNHIQQTFYLRERVDLTLVDCVRSIIVVDGKLKLFKKDGDP